MDFFQHRYYKINKVLLTILGQWPYQTTRIRYSLSAATILIITTLFVPHALNILKYNGDWHFFLERMTPMLIGSMGGTKFLYSILTSHKMMELLNNIRADWQMWACEREVHIVHKYAEWGRKLTILYAVVNCSSCILFLIQPMVPKIMDVLFQNGSKPGEFPTFVDYHHLDMQKYYFYIMMHYFVSSSIGHLVVIAYDSMFMVFVQHSCGIFAALGHKLARIGENNGTSETGADIYPSEKKDVDFEHLLVCINRHNRAIKSVELEATYSWSFFFAMGFSIIEISILGVQILRRIMEPQDTIRFVVLNALMILHLYIHTYLPQTLMDHSVNIHYYIVQLKWYRLSLKTQKLLLLMTLRCTKPCKLTAGKIIDISAKTFATIIKTSVSYFTVLQAV